MSEIQDAIRFAINTSSTDKMLDVITGATPDMWRGTSLRVEFGVFKGAGDAKAVVPVTNYTSIKLEVKAALNGNSAPSPNSAALMSQELALAELDAGMTAEDFDAGTAQHGVFEFTDAETNFAFEANETQKNFWLVISAVGATGRRTLGCTLLRVFEDGTGDGSPAPEPGDPDYYTADESDARFIVKSGDTMTGALVLSGAPTLALHAVTKGYADTADALLLPLAGGTLSGQLNFSGTTHAGVKLLSLTTTQKNALTAANGMLLYDSTLGRLQAYDGGAWRGLVRLTGDTMTGLLTLSADPSSAMHAATKQFVEAAVAGIGYFVNPFAQNDINEDFSLREENTSTLWTCNALLGFNGGTNPNLISRIGGTETLTNKTLTDPAVTDGTFSEPLISSPTLDGTVTLSNPEITGTASFTGEITFDGGTLVDAEFVGRPKFTINSNGSINSPILVMDFAGGHDSSAGPDMPIAEVRTYFGGSLHESWNFGLYGENSQTYSFNGATIFRFGDFAAEFADALDAVRGAAFGVAALDGSGKIPLAEIPDSVLGQVEYQGTWDANANLPTIPGAGTAYKGHYYVVSTAGASNQGGITDWKVGDWLICNGTAWEKVDNTDAVSSVFGRTGAVVAANGDYNTSQITEVTNLFFTEARVRASVLTGINTSTPGTVTSADSVLSALGKIQATLGTLSSLSATAPITYAAGVIACNAASANTASYLVQRDGSGNFSAGTITASLTGAASLNLLLTGGTLTGNLLFSSDNTRDIGASGATRPRTGYFGTSLITPLVTSTDYGFASSRGKITAPSDGVITLLDNAGTAFSRLQFGGTTTSFPALKRSSAGLECRLGDDSAFAIFKAKQLRPEVATVSYAGSVAIDFDAAGEQEITATGDLALTTSNLAAGKSVLVRVEASGVTVNLTFPSWNEFGSALPASIASGEVIYITLRARGGTDGDVDAIYIESI